MGKRFFLIIINPQAGRRKYEWKLSRIKMAFDRRGFDYDVLLTESDQKADSLIKNYFNPEKHTDLLIFGGDGTLNEAVNGLGDLQVPISIISTGSGNDSIRPLYERRKFLDQMHLALDGNVEKFDAGICNGRLFVNGVGIGFDGKVVELMQNQNRKYKGYVSYLQTVLNIIATYREKPITFWIDGESFNEPILLLTIANGTTFGGGFMITPHAKMNDGLLEICIIGKIAPWKRFLHLPKMAKGRHDRLRAVRFLKGKEIQIEPSKDVVAHIDGEFFGNPPFTIKILKNHLLFRVPR